VASTEDFVPSPATATDTVTGEVTHTVTGLQPDTGYFVLIEARDLAGEISWSNRLFARTVETTAVRNSNVLLEQTEDRGGPICLDRWRHYCILINKCFHYATFGLGAKPTLE